MAVRKHPELGGGGKEEEEEGEEEEEEEEDEEQGFVSWSGEVGELRGGGEVEGG